MAPFIFIRENDYVGLAILVVALEEAGCPIRYCSYADLAEQCSQMVGWEVEDTSLRRALRQVNTELRHPSGKNKYPQDVARIKKYLI